MALKHKIQYKLSLFFNTTQWSESASLDYTEDIIIFKIYALFS